MLNITIEYPEQFDEQNNIFITREPVTIALEHSLVSISKWEAKWHIPFLSREKKTPEQTLDYVKCMTITQNVNPEVYNLLSPKNLNEINAYITDPMTATNWLVEKKDNSKSKSETVTSELIYYNMIASEIPFECQKWHLNRLLTLIRICKYKNQPTKKMSKRETMVSNAKLNAARRKRFNTSG